MTTLSSCQQNAYDEFMDFMDSDADCFVLTGGPGRGKSFLTKFLIEAVERSYGNKWTVHCTATTNKAAKVLEEHVDREAGTIHSLLGLVVKSNYGTGKQYLSRTPDSSPIHNCLVVVDECSMADKQLLKYISELTVRCKILFVGDRDQLSPVNEAFSPVFYRNYPSYELMEVMRQKAGSPIISLANQLRDTIRTGQFKPISHFHDGNTIEFVDGPTFQEIVDDNFSTNLGKPDHGKLIAWTNDKVTAYNGYCRQLHTSSEQFELDEWVVTNIPVMQADVGTIYPTDTIVQVTDVRADELHGVAGHWHELENKIEVFQPASRPQAQALLKSMAAEARANPKLWKDFFEVKESFGDLRAVHSCTAHKSQGSSYDVSYIDLSDIGECRQWETVARLLYVAVTRARHKVVFYGSLPAKYTNGSFKCNIPSSVKVQTDDTEPPF